MDTSQTHAVAEVMRESISRIESDFIVANPLQDFHDPEGAALEALQLIQTIKHLLPHAERGLVIQARNAHVTWAAIGQVLGTTRQAAQSRFGKATK